MIALYQVGGGVAVHHDPADPTSSTLSTSTAGTAINEILGWVCIAAGAFVASIRLMA